jgi:hypothetical protein
MTTRGSIHPEPQPLALPASTRARLAWRTPAMSAAQSLIAGLPFSFSALTRANQFLAWHDRLAHRFSAVSGALPTLLELGSDSPSDTFTPGGDFDFGSVWAEQGLRATFFASLSPLTLGLHLQETPPRVTSPPETGSRDGFERNAQELRPIRHVDGEPESQAGAPPLHRFEVRWVAAETTVAPPIARRTSPERAMPNLPISPAPRLPEARQEPRTRLRLSVSLSPRREMPPDYPHREVPVAGRVVAETLGGSEIQPVAADDVSTPGWEAARRLIASSAVQTARANSTAQSETAEETLLKQGGEPSASRPLHIRSLTARER